MTRRLPKFLLVLVIFILALLLAVAKQKTFSISPSVLISEVQIQGTTAYDEFIELYNPTGTSVDLAGWRLTKKISSGTQNNLKSSLSGIVEPYSYRLYAHTGYTGSVSPDDRYSTNSVTDNNTVILYSDSGITVIDKVGMGEAMDFETKATFLPKAFESIERITSIDTDDNSVDFHLRPLSNPQNSASASAYITPTATSTPTSTPTPTETPTPTPALTPAATPTPTTAPSGPAPKIVHNGPILMCWFEYKEASILYLKIYIPKLFCIKK